MVYFLVGGCCVITPKSTQLRNKSGLVEEGTAVECIPVFATLYINTGSENRHPMKSMLLIVTKVQVVLYTL